MIITITLLSILIGSFCKSMETNGLGMIFRMKTDEKMVDYFEMDEHYYVLLERIVFHPESSKLIEYEDFHGFNYFGHFLVVKLQKSTLQTIWTKEIVINDTTIEPRRNTDSFRKYGLVKSEAYLQPDSTKKQVLFVCSFQEEMMIGESVEEINNSTFSEVTFTFIMFDSHGLILWDKILGPLENTLILENDRIVYDYGHLDERYLISRKALSFDVQSLSDGSILLMTNLFHINESDRTIFPFQKYLHVKKLNKTTNKTYTETIARTHGVSVVEYKPSSKKYFYILKLDAETGKLLFSNRVLGHVLPFWYFFENSCSNSFELLLSEVDDVSFNYYSKSHGEKSKREYVLGKKRYPIVSFDQDEGNYRSDLRSKKIETFSELMPIPFVPENINGTYQPKSRIIRRSGDVTIMFSDMIVYDEDSEPVISGFHFLTKMKSGKTQWTKYITVENPRSVKLEYFVGHEKEYSFFLDILAVINWRDFMILEDDGVILVGDNHPGNEEGSSVNRHDWNVTVVRLDSDGEMVWISSFSGAEIEGKELKIRFKNIDEVRMKLDGSGFLVDIEVLEDGDVEKYKDMIFEFDMNGMNEECGLKNDRVNKFGVQMKEFRNLELFVDQTFNIFSDGFGLENQEMGERHHRIIYRGGEDWGILGPNDFWKKKYVTNACLVEETPKKEDDGGVGGGDEKQEENEEKKRRVMFFR